MDTYHKKTLILCKYRQSKEEPDYGSCLWADIYIDKVQRTVMIISDCGNYSYKWPQERTDFVQFLKKLRSSYLLEKFNVKEVINREETVESLMEIFDEKERMNVEEAVYGCNNSMDLLIYQLLSIDPMIDVYDLSDYIITEYPANAIKIVNVFLYVVKKL